MTVTRRRHKNRLWLLLLPLFLAGFVWWQIEGQLQPIVEAYSENGAKTLATRTVNEAVTALLSDAALTEDLVRRQTDAQGNVVLLETDAQKINTMKLAVTDQVLKRLERETSQSLSIPVGTLIGSDLFSGRGPVIPVEISVNYAVTTDVTEKWRSAGINQTAHCLRLQIRVDMVLAISGRRQVNTSQTTDYFVSETILVGQVPDTYANWYRTDTAEGE